MTGLDVEAWARLHANYSGRTLGIIFRVQRESACTQVQQIRESGQASDHAVGRELSEICPKDVKEQMMRLDEISENYGNLMAEVVSHATNRTERGKHRRVRNRNREHERWSEGFFGQEERRVCGGTGRTSGVENDKNCEIRRPGHE